MAEQTTSSIHIDAGLSEVMAVIIDYESYPEWVQGMKDVRVLDRDERGRGHNVFFRLEAPPIKDSYTLTYTYDGENALHWQLTEGTVLRAMDGTYELEAQGEGTHVTYRLAVELAIPIIGMLRRKAEKVIIDTALRGLKKRVEAGS